MVWIIVIGWFWSIGLAVGFVPTEDKAVRRLAIIVALGVPIVAFFTAL